MNWRIFFVIVVISLIMPSTIHAQEISPTPKPVDYTLPYPGLLPDNPFYFLRTVRDTMQSFFVSNPLKKAEFALLQSDKGIGASVLLAQKKDTAVLAGATARESQDYFETAIEEAVAAKKQGLDTHALLQKLRLANEKHQETLMKLKEQSLTEHTEDYIKAVEKAQVLEKRIKSLLPAK